jgi:steroid delta-isomerase-like uncharacterized protein
MQMSAEQNKALVRKMFDMIVTGNTADVAQVIAPDWVNIDPALPPMKGIEGAKQLMTLFSSAFPGSQIKMEALVAEGDKVAVHFSFSGTHKGAFLNIPPTGKSFSVTGTGIFRFKDGKVVENRVVFDAVGLMQQLGVAPAPGA